MPRAPKYHCFVIARKTLYVAYDGSLLASQPATDEAMLDAFQSIRKYMYVELYYKAGEIVGNTISEIKETLYASSHDMPLDGVLYFTRKAGKPYHSQPVGQTWLPTMF